MEPGYQPLTEQAKARTGDWMRPGQVGPPRIELESDLARANFFVGGIGELFAEYKIAGYQEALGRLKEQIAEYDAWVTKEILPKSRTDFRRPPEQYAFSLQQFGVDVPPAQLTAMAHKAFDEWQAEMQDIAQQVAKSRGFASTRLSRRNPRAQERPDRRHGNPAALSTAVERHRADHRARASGFAARAPRGSAGHGCGNGAATGAEHGACAVSSTTPAQQGEFVLPLNVPASGAAETCRLDDFTFGAASWTLTAHEARPGHELQFAAMVEQRRVAGARLFAFNSVNVEGWGLYAEAEMKPFDAARGPARSRCSCACCGRRARSSIPSSRSAASRPRRPCAVPHGGRRAL